MQRRTQEKFCDFWRTVRRSGKRRRLRQDTKTRQKRERAAILFLMAE